MWSKLQIKNASSAKYLANEGYTNYYYNFFLLKCLNIIANIFALQSTPSAMMGASVTPWPSTTMMDRVSLDDIPHKGNKNNLHLAQHSKKPKINASE